MFPFKNNNIKETINISIEHDIKIAKIKIKKAIIA
jgi:hypothetical protein